MEENKCEVIADYENLTDLPYQKRCTEYSTAFGIYVFKLDCTQEMIARRYVEAKSYLEGRITATGKKLVAVFSKTITGSIQDTAHYQLSAELDMLRLFRETEAVEKKLGVEIGSETYMLLRKEEAGPVEMITLPFGLCEERYMERLDFIRSRWMRQLTVWAEEEHNEQIKRTVELGERLQGKQESFPYAREIKKRMESCERIFREQRMEGYDFRETDLQNAIFLNCKLAHSNFSGVNLENAVFVNCDLTGCLWYGSMLNHCAVYAKGELLWMADRNRTYIG